MSEMSGRAPMNIPALRFADFKGEWKSTSLSSVTSDCRGGAALTPSDFVSFSNCVVIPKKAIEAGGELSLGKDRTYCTHSFFAANMGNQIDNSYLVTTLRDLVPSGPSIGYIVQFSELGKFILAQGVYGFRTDKQKLLPSFLTAISNRQPYRRIMQRIMVGSTQVHIRNGDFFGLKFPLPTLPEQQKIADFLGAVDARTGLLKRRREALAAYKRAMMQRLFGLTLRFTNPDGSRYPDWQKKRLGELGEFCGGGTPDTNHADNWAGDIPWISSSDISEDSIRDINVTRKITREALAGSATKIVPPRSILIVSRVGVGKLAVSTTELCTSQDFCNFTPHTDEEIFLAYWISHNKNVLLALCQGTSIKGLTTVDIKGLKVPIPHLEEQKKISEFLAALDAKIVATSAQISALQRFKQGLLQQMFV